MKVQDLPLHARIAYRAAQLVGLAGAALYLAGAAVTNGIAGRFNREPRRAPPRSVA